MKFFRADLSLSCTCPFCGGEDIVGACILSISLGRFGVIAHDPVPYPFSPDAEFSSDESLFRGLCQTCERTFAITIESSVGSAHTLRELGDSRYVTAVFSDVGRPIALQIGKTLHMVESIGRQAPFGGVGPPGGLGASGGDDPLFQLYPPRFESLFGRPPYVDWELRLKSSPDEKRALFPLGPSCEISVTPAPSLNQTQGDLLSVTVHKADEGMLRLLSETPTARVCQSLPPIFLTMAGLSVALRMERRLSEFLWQRLKQYLGKHDKLWWKQLLDRRSIEKIEQRSKPAGRRIPTTARDLHQFLTLGEARALIESHWDPVFVRQFSGRHRILGILAELEEIRNEAAHGRPVTFKEYARCVDVAERVGQFFALSESGA